MKCSHKFGRDECMNTGQPRQMSSAYPRVPKRERKKTKDDEKSMALWTAS